ncbi:MAG: hypothetical protein M1833_004099 [Piccolia ochrophora]|nr:MAG: hypothetical protein M1833_004099 [Piccolia ochrophora]
MPALVVSCVYAVFLLASAIGTSQVPTGTPQYGRPQDRKERRQFLSANGPSRRNTISFATKRDASQQTASIPTVRGRYKDYDQPLHWISEISLGKKRFKVRLDTGSADLYVHAHPFPIATVCDSDVPGSWVYSVHQPSSQWGFHSVYDPRESATFVDVPGSSAFVGYEGEGDVNGTLGKDALEFGGIHIESQVFVLAADVMGVKPEESETDGVLGLALGYTGGDTIRPRLPLFLDNLMPLLEHPVFTADIRSNSGSFDFGKIESAEFEGQLTNFSINGVGGFWTIDAPVTVAGVAIDLASYTAPEIDTGSPVIYMSRSIAQAYYKNVPGANGDDYAWYMSCSIEPPPLDITIGKTYKVSIPGSFMRLATDPKNSSQCVGALQVSGSFTLLGDPFLKAQFAVFWPDVPQIGLASKP